MCKTIFLTLVVIFLASCHNSKNKKANNLPTDETNAKSKIETNKYQTQSGKQFIISADYSIGASICDLKIETSGFTEKNTIHKLGLTDPVTDVFIIDLDKNGYEEIYLITTSAGSGSYSTIYGLASNKDKSATPIYIYEPSQKQLGQGGIFEGYRGHNKFDVQNGIITNTYPTFDDADTNAKPSGKKRNLSYSLMSGEAGWILQVMDTIP